MQFRAFYNKTSKALFLTKKLFIEILCFFVNVPTGEAHSVFYYADIKLA